MRVGIGYAVRDFDPSRVLVLGGVKIQDVWGLRGPGDGDVLLRAVTDALLGGAALGQADDHFPDDDETWRDEPSAALLAEALTKVEARGLAPTGLDATLVSERPHAAAHRGRIRERLAALLGLAPERVNVKTAETIAGGLGPADGIAALTTVVLAERAA